MEIPPNRKTCQRVFQALRIDVNHEFEVLYEFMEKLLGNTARPLKELTGDIHFHTIEAESDRILDLVEEGLKEKQFLIS